MIRFSILVLLLLINQLDAKETSIPSWIQEPFSSLFAHFDNVSVFPHTSEKNIVAAYCESEKQWWGTLRVFSHAGDNIEWVAAFPKEYIDGQGHYVVSCRWNSVSMLENKLLEVVSSTHMGNGSLWLFELKDRELRLLLCTPMRGRYWEPTPEFAVPPNGGEARFDHLAVEYRKIDTFETVFLTGRVSIIDQEGKELSSKPYQQQCTWDKEKRVFTAFDEELVPGTALPPPQGVFPRFVEPTAEPPVAKAPKPVKPPKAPKQPKAAV